MTATTNQVKARPILFSGAMVRAILEGRKTHTRRVVKYRITGPNPPNASTFDCYDGDTWVGAFGRDGRGNFTKLCPYGKPGDQLWVRETWAILTGRGHRLVYRADADPPMTCGGREPVSPMKWRSSTHMPRWASRITLEIVSVRVERLQEISVDDAIAEGISGVEFCPTVEHEACRFEPVWHYMNLWNSINAKRGYGWDKNPWVWVIEFRMAE